MRIGVNTLFLIPGEVGGTETYLRETLLAMAALSAETEWVLFTNRENDRYFRRIFGSFPHVAYHPLPLRATNRYARIIREQIDLPFRAARSCVDLLWSPGYTAPFFASCPQVVTIHDMQYKRYPQDLTFLARFATNVLVRMAVARCNRVIAVSDFSRQEIIHFTKADPGKVTVIYEAATPGFSGPIPDHLKQRRLKKLLPAQKPYILCIANTYPHKNVHLLIDAFGQILEKIPHQLVLVGKPRLGEPEVRKALGGVSDPSRIQRLMQVDFNDLAVLYQGADIFVFPSLYEGFGLPVLEAMMAGVPVLTTKCGSIPEVGGEQVCYFDPHSPADLARQIIEMSAWRSEGRKIRVTEARIHASGLSWRRTAEKTMECFKQTGVVGHG